MIRILTPCLAIMAIFALSTIALVNGIDGVLLAGAFSIIGGLGGYGIKVIKDKIKS